MPTGCPMNISGWHIFKPQIVNRAPVCACGVFEDGSKPVYPPHHGKAYVIPARELNKIRWTRRADASAVREVERVIREAKKAGAYVERRGESIAVIER